MPQYPIWILPSKDAATDTDPATIVWRDKRVVWDVARKVIRVGDGATAGGVVFQPRNAVRRSVSFTAEVTTATVADTDQLVEVDASAAAGSIIYPVGFGSPARAMPVLVVKKDGSTNPVSIVPTAGGAIAGVLLTKNSHAHVWSDGTALVVAGC